MPSAPRTSRAVTTVFLRGEPTLPPVLYQRPHWFACYTHGRHEKRVAARMEECGIESYLPTFVRAHRWSDRTRQVRVPMFPSYVFGRFVMGELSRVLGIRGLSTIVRVRGRPQPVPDLEIEQVRRLARLAEEQGIEPDMVPFLEEGTRVRIIDGPFVGVEGVVTKRQKKTAVYVGLSAIQQGLTIEVPLDSLERVAPDPAARLAS